MAAPIGGAFNGAQVDGYVPAGGRFADRAQVTAFNDDGFVCVVRVKFFLQRGLEPGAIGTFDPERISGHKRLTECDNVAALRGRLFDPVDDFRDARIALQPGWRNLRQPDFAATVGQSKFFR